MLLCASLHLHSAITSLASESTSCYSWPRRLPRSNILQAVGHYAPMKVFPFNCDYRSFFLFFISLNGNWKHIALWSSFTSAHVSLPRLTHIFKLESHFWSSWCTAAATSSRLKFKRSSRVKWQILNGDEPEPGTPVTSTSRMLGFDGRSFNNIPLGSWQMGERTDVMSAKFSSFQPACATRSPLRCFGWFAPGSRLSHKLDSREMVQRSKFWFLFFFLFS